MVGKQPILLVEDSIEDFEAIKRGFRKAGMINPLHHCSDGDEALDYLYRRNQYADPASSPRPGVILLDLNLPGTDGREVLKVVKSKDRFRLIPVIILTTSSDPRDIQTCYAMGANSYIQKPVELTGFMNAVQQLRDYWFELTILPVEDI